ncbi:MAG: beta-hydroxyacyl-ACP dehydratase [Phycisphaeraceae bacterium]|nr:beta-hydroxyacyl-ACP dehydratase [Phycisphaeraceae bacterium]MCW5753871.1 beta-hydroxyacyl-ACP dehydratase [Phycisphaeraceae bacterium]
MTSFAEQTSPSIQRDKLLFELANIDLNAIRLDKDGLARWNPHRGHMALLDALIWESDDHSLGVGVKHVREDEFWVAGHFPGQPMMPGVLQVECGAQLACYLFNVKKGEPTLAAFLRIEHAAFRSMVVPGDDLYILCRDIKRSRRRFVCDVQGVVRDRIAFEAQISGMAMGEGPQVIADA